MHRLLFVAVILSVVVTTNGPEQSASAQAPGFAAQSTFQANEITNFKGTLKGTQRGVVVVEKEDGTEAFVAPPDLITSFQFVAKATPAFLQRGTLMRFMANFGPGGVPQAPVSKITLFQPLQQANLKSLPGRAKQQFTPGVYSDAKAGNRNQAMTGNLTIVGRMIGLSPGVLAVQAGKVPVRVPVNDATELEVRYNNLALAQVGDPVTVSGFYQPPNENQVKADRVTITTDRVYGEYKPDDKKKRKRGDDDKVDDDEGDSDDEKKEDDENKTDEADKEDS